MPDVYDVWLFWRGTVRPPMFRASELQPIEVALLSHVCFDLENFEDAERRVNPAVQIRSVSTTRGDGRDAVYERLRARRKQLDRWEAAPTP